MDRSLLGFDEEFDATAVDTRRQAGDRVVIAVLVFLAAVTAIPLSSIAVWAAMLIVGDGVLWIATDPRNQQRRPVLFRAVRLAATLLSTLAWVTIALMWLHAPVPHGDAVAVALMGGVLLYGVQGCHRSLLQLSASALPPSLGLLYAPFTAAGLTEGAGFMGATGLVVMFGLASAMKAWRTHRRLRQTNLALVEKQREAEAASVAKSEFLANMSHEIRTPLNGILAMAHTLQEGQLPPREQEAARLICSSGELLNRLLSDVLDLARVEAGQVEVRAAPFHAGDLARSVGALARTKAHEKGVALGVDVAPEVDRTYLGDAVRVRQILSNLLSNAVKFTDRGEVRLHVAPRPEGGVRFTVSDTGVGFDPLAKGRLFERFQQADGAITRRFGGTGLGLSISRHLAELMGGAVDCDSTPGVGSVFRLDLPLAPTGEARPEAAEAAAEPDRALRLLVADDHPTNRKVVEIILAGAGMEATAVEDGQQAVDAFAAGAFDLVFMDMQMPVMDGLTAVERIRAAEAAAGAARTPIVMLTANALPEHVEAGRRAGADGHLTKPITPAALFEAIAAAMGAPAPQPQAAEAVA